MSDSDCTIEHTACTPTGSGSSLCECAPGYVSGSSGCIWSGVVSDPEVKDPSAWSLIMDATIDPTIDGSGQLDPGEAQLQTCGHVSPGGYITQTVQMPRRSRAEPLVLVSNLQANNGPAVTSIGLGAQLGKTHQQAFYGTAVPPWYRLRTCIGAADFQPENASSVSRSVKLVTGFVRSSETDLPCSQVSYLAAVDHVDVVPANPGECPDPGTVLNGDCEGSGGWKFWVNNAADSASIQPGVGDNSSAAVELALGLTCDSAGASTLMDAPMPSVSGTAALSVYHSAAQRGFTMNIGADAEGLGALSVPLSGSGSQPTTERYCVPAYFRGTVTNVNVKFDPTYNGETCDVPMPVDVIVDDLELVNDPQCGTDPYVADPGFESGYPVIGLSAQGVNGPGGSATLVSDSAAHGGTHDLQLSVDTACGQASYAIPVEGPPATATTGPALTFWYRYPAGSSTAMQVSNDSPFQPVRDGQWHQEHQCMSPNLFGPTSFSVAIVSTVGPPCPAPEPTETVSIDDLEIASDPACAPAPSSGAPRSSLRGRTLSAAHR